MLISLDKCWNACDDKKKNQICPIPLIIKILDQKWIFWVFLRTLLIDILSRQSMLQINGCGRTSNEYS